MNNIPYTEQMLKNKDIMRRDLFIETVKNPNYCCHYTGILGFVVTALINIQK
jgi:hypothetical protein